MKSAALLTVLALTLVSCETPPSAPAAASGTPLLDRAGSERTNESAKQPFAGTVYNPCPPAELVAIEGVVHYNYHVDEYENGHLDIRGHVNTQRFDGVGLVTGLKYNFMDHNKFASEIQKGPDSTYVSTGVLRDRLIRQTGADDYVVTVRYTFTFNRRDGLKLQAMSMSDCRG